MRLLNAMKNHFVFVLLASLLLAGIISLPTDLRAKNASVAETIYVTIATDVIDYYDGACSLREAVINANNNSAPAGVVGECPAGAGSSDVIYLMDKPIYLDIKGADEDYAAEGDLDIREGVSIIGVSPAASVIDANHLDRVFEVIGDGVNLNLSLVTVRGGYINPAIGWGYGGGLLVNANNSAYINNVEFTNNHASSQSFLGSGGAIFVYVGAHMTVENSLIDHNISDTYGGGIGNMGELNITNSTISHNEGSNTVGSGGLHNNGQISVGYSTLAFNSPYAVKSMDGTINEFQGTILASNSYANCSYSSYASFTGNYNISSDGSCNFIGTGNLSHVDPKLGPLGSYGGPTWTYPLLPSSMAIDWIPATGVWSPIQDQRGVPRPQDGNHNGDSSPDVGAVEQNFDLRLIYLPLVRR